MRLIFMGTPGFAVPALDALLAARHEIAAVYCQPPRPAGRGRLARPGAVHARALAVGLDVRTPVTLRDPAEQAALAALGAEAAVVAAYGLILPVAVLAAQPHGCLNIHASLLPRWRGAAPIQRAILAGDAESGVCIMAMEEGLDTGPVLLRQATLIGPADTAGTLTDRLSLLGARLIVETLDRRRELAPEPQPQAGVTYAAKIDKAEARIDWAEPATAIDRRIRALAPLPGAWCEIAGERVKLLTSTVVPGGGPPGLVLDDSLTVACGGGALSLGALQRAGGRVLGAADFLRGFPAPMGSLLA